PTSGATVSGTITVTATASDNVALGVRFTLDGAPLGPGYTSPPYSTSWDTSTATNGSHVLSAVAQDAAGNQTASVINVNVSNGSNGGASGPSVTGQWSAPFGLPIRDVHMMLFRTGDVLLWD